MSSPSYYDDGDFSIALQNNCTRYSFPFVEKGDPLTFVATRTYRQDARDYRQKTLMLREQFPMGVAYLVAVSDARDVGNGILEWDDTFASVPQTRREYGSIPYTQQLQVDTIRGIQEFTGTRDAVFLYEYSLWRPLPRILGPRVVQFDNVIYAVGNWGLFQPGQEILAQDTESEIYMARIYQRRSVLIEYQPLVQIT